MTDVLGPAGRKGHRYDMATVRTSKISESHLGLENAAELPGSTYPKPAGDRLRINLPDPTQLSLCFQREGCPCTKVFCSPGATDTQPREKCKDSH